MGLSRLAVAFDLTVVVGGALFARSGYYEQFADVPGVHAGHWPDSERRGVDHAGRGAARRGVQRMARIVKVAALIATVAAWVAWNVHFLSTAGLFG